MVRGGLAKRIVEQLAVFALCYFSVRISAHVATKNGVPAWPPTGVALGALILSGPRVAPAVALGALLANLGNAAGWPASFGLAAVGTGVPFLAAQLMPRFKFNSNLGTVADVLILLGVGCGCMVLSATLGTAILVAAGQVATSDYWSTWQVWWLGDALRVILFTPLILTAFSVSLADSPAAKRPLNSVVLAILVTGAYVGIFASTVSLRYLTFPIVTAAALRYRQQGAAFTSGVSSLASLWAFANQLGPSSYYAPGNLINILLFDGAVGVSGLILAAVEAERFQSARELEIATSVLEDRVKVRTAEVDQARMVAEDASRAKSEYLSRMSHELRTPLTAIIGFAELKVASESGVDDHIHSILKAADHLEALVDDALDIARIESGRIDLTLEPVDLAAICDESIELVRAAEPDRTVSVKLDFPKRPYLAVADAERLSQVVTNLLSNGFKYGGGWLQVSITRTHGRIRFHVADKGQGLSQAQLQSLFQPFERVGAERTEIHGTGLGLALCKRLISAMGGDIGVESHVGRGSRFWVELNAAKGETPSDTAVRVDPAQTNSPTQDRTILSIEDNPNVISLLNGIINLRPNLHLITIPTGTGALEAVLEHKPDLVLLDLHLPDTDGEEVLRTIKGDPRTSSVSIVVLSADATSERVQRLLNAGADAYLTKPIRISTFLSVVDKTMGVPS